MYEESIHAKLSKFRRSIDNLDAALISILAERFRCTQAVGALKAENDMPPSDPGRETAQVSRLRDVAEQAGLDPDFAESHLKFVIAEVIRQHEDVAVRHAKRAADN